MFLFFALTNVSFAQEEVLEENQIREANIVAQVGVYNTRVIERDSELYVTFDIENAGINISEVNYSIKLYQQGVDGKPVALIDEVVNEETFSLAPRQLLKEEFSYTPPFSLNGTYQFWVEVSTNNGLPLATGFARDVEIEGENNFIFLGQGECKLSVDGEDFSLLQGVDVDSNEELLFLCDSRNLSNQPLNNLDINLSTYERVTSGNSLGEQTVATTSYSSSQSKKLSFQIPLQSTDYWASSHRCALACLQLHRYPKILKSRC